MGTDIHGFIRNKRHDTVITTLEKAGIWHRNYTLFAAIAGVRNGSGFAGCYRHDPVEPLTENRGLPESDLIDGYSFWCPESMSDYTDDGKAWLGDHSYTHFSVAEMLEHFEVYNPPVRFGGVLSEKEYLEWDKKSSPDSYCGGISGPDLITVTETNYKLKKYPEGKSIYIRCYWHEPLRERIQYFIDGVLTAIGDIDPKDAEIICGFDS